MKRKDIWVLLGVGVLAAVLLILGQQAKPQPVKQAIPTLSVALGKFDVELQDADSYLRIKQGDEYYHLVPLNSEAEIVIKQDGNKENIILIGTPGAGKTHYAIALGIAACMKGHNVLFASVPNLIVELKETMSNNQFTNYRRRFETYDLVILDELGYVSLDKTGCEMLFNLISARNDKGSIIVTSNLTFDRWEEVFKDPTLTGALIDRLAHKAHILDISRDKGGRFEDTIAWLEDSKR